MNRIGGVIAVALAGSRSMFADIHSFNPRKQRQLGKIDDDGGAAPLGHFEGMSGESESCDVGRRVRTALQHGVTGTGVQLHHTPTGQRQQGRGAGVPFGRRSDESGSEWLGEHETIARFGVRIGEDTIRVDGARHGEAKLNFCVADRVPTDDGAVRRSTAFGSASEDFAEPIHVQAVVREADEIHGGARRASHGIHVGKGIGGRDLTVDERVVDHGGKEVDGLNQREIGRNPVDARVVVRFGADEQVRVVLRGKVAQNLSDAAGGQFTRSPRARSIVCEPFAATEPTHGQIPQFETKERGGRCPRVTISAGANQAFDFAANDSAKALSSGN